MPDTPVHDSPATARHARNGIVLFIVYVVLYGGFVYLSAFRADLMGSKPFGGVNLAILYGMGLIVSAFVLALIYMLLCRPKPGESTSDGKGGVA
jgi:uncharacterized membrane protein (DUF485 family)